MLVEKSAKEIAPTKSSRTLYIMLMSSPSWTR